MKGSMVLGALCVLCALSAGVGNATLTVKCSANRGKITHNAAGILHSFSAREPSDELVIPLRLKSFRGRANDRYLLSPGFYERLKRVGVDHIQVVLSDSYGYPNGFFGWPGDNGSWSAWEKTVNDVVESCRKGKKSVEYDLWNEPDIKYFWGKDRRAWLETWRLGFLKLRSLDKDAPVVGPSVSHFSVYFLEEFLIFAQSNNCLPDVLSWHELSSADGAGIPKHLRQVRALLKSKGISIKRFSINEIIPNNRQFSPGTAVSYFANIEGTSIESACHSCWGDLAGDNGENRSLDGMLTHDSKRPRSSWWAYRKYADVAGRILSVTGDADPKARVEFLGAYDRSAKRLVLLAGNCGKEIFSSQEILFNEINHVKGVTKKGLVHVRVESIPDTETNPLETPILILDQNVFVQNNSLRFLLPKMEPGEALAVTLQSP